MAKKYGIIVKSDINRLARLYYRMMGYTVPEGYDFSKAHHPTEKMVWQQAEISFEFWTTRIDQALKVSGKKIGYDKPSEEG